MQISAIYVSQRKLRCAVQIPPMIETLEVGGCLPRITLSRPSDGSVQLEDGHHRLTAIWMTGRRELKQHEYLLVDKDQWRPRLGRITDLLERCCITADRETKIH